MSFLGEPFKHDLFVSYSHGTFAGAHHFPLREWSRTFAADLEAQLRQILHFRQVDLFLDAKERPGQGVDPTEPLTEGLKQHIAGSALLVILMSPDYLASGWCQKEREWWWQQQMPDTLGVGGRIFVCRVMPSVNDLNWSPQLDAGNWPPMLKEGQDSKFTGFWFHAQNDVHFATVPYKWEGQTSDTNDYNTEMRRLVHFITQRLSEIRHRLEEQKREAEEQQKLAGSGRKIIYLHGRAAQPDAWRGARLELQSHYTVLPTAPEASLLNAALPDLKAIQMALTKRRLQMAECDAVLMVRTASDPEFEIDLAGIGRNDRAYVRDLTGKLLPCAVLDLVGEPIEAVIELAIERLDGCRAGWVQDVAIWLERSGRIWASAA